MAEARGLHSYSGQLIMPTIKERKPIGQSRLSVDLPSGYGINLCFENENDLETVLRSIFQALDEGNSLEKLFKTISNE